MNSTDQKHLGIIQTLIEEFEKHRLPRLLKLKEKVDRGEILSETDLVFLCTVTEDAERTMSITVTHPELHEFCLCVAHLYHDISREALENEKKLSH